MAVAQSTGRMQRAILSVVLFFALLFLALWGLDASVVIKGVERCPYQFPKWLGCIIANHETLSGSLITVAGALFAAWIAWQAVIDQIKSDKELERNAQRAIVHGGPGNRIIENGIETKVVFSGQNTGTSEVAPVV